MIGIQFTVQPIEIAVDQLAVDVAYDITRRADALACVLAPPWRRLGPRARFPKQIEEPNDDLNDFDESAAPNVAGHMYVIDAPGPGDESTTRTQLRELLTFEEFMRVRFDGRALDGNVLAGSACSNRFAWSHGQRLLKKPARPGVRGVYKRTTGERRETRTNFIKPGATAIRGLPCK